MISLYVMPSRIAHSSGMSAVVCAVDCGVAINPDIIRAQMEGGIGFGLAAALDGAITLKEGRVEQRCQRSRCISYHRRKTRPASASLVFI